MESVDTFMGRARAALADTKLVQSVVCAAEQLREEGYAVVPSILARDLCDQYHAQFWQMMQEATEGRLWRPHGAEDLADFKVTGNWARNMHGILEDGQFAHLPFVHAIRGDPRVQLVFALLYGEGRKLTSSVDRLNYQLPAEWLAHARLSNATDPTDIGHIDEASWLHIDQAPNKQGLYCIQGLVNLEDTHQDGDASLELVPRSHILHDSLESLTGDPSIPNRDWYKFPDDVKQKIQQETGLLRTFKSVKASKGDLILWDSRTWHQGGRIRAHVLAPRPIPRPRFAVYVCMQPNLVPGATSLPPKELVKREKIFSMHRAASHWPLSSKVFGPPQTYGKPQPLFDFSPFLTSRASLDTYPVRKHMYGFAYDERIDLLGNSEQREPLLEFAPASGVNKKHPRTDDKIKNKRPVKKMRKD